MPMEKPIVIAHRGAAGEAPENTLSAFKLALEQDCDAFELDVHLSKDGEIVVIHDASVKRTSNGSGNVRDMTTAELKTLDAGRWFHERYEGERLPLLEEVFDLAPPHLMINVEIKGSYGVIEAALAGLLKRKNRIETVVVSSFDFKSLSQLKRLEPEAKIGLLYDLRLPHHAQMAKTAGVPVYSLHPSFWKLDREDVSEVIQEGLRIYPWTINDESLMQRAIAYGVSGIITDFPGRLRHLLGGR